jgi:hypothetical protein
MSEKLLSHRVGRAGLTDARICTAAAGDGPLRYFAAVS